MLCVLNKRINDRIQNEAESSLTIRALYQEMHSHRSKTWSLASIRKSSGFYKNYLKPYPHHDFLIERITFKDIQDHLDEIQKESSNKKKIKVLSSSEIPTS